MALLTLCFTRAFSFPQANQTQQASLYKRLGGYDAIAAITDDLFGCVVTDPQLSRFFKGHSLDTQKRQRQNVVIYSVRRAPGPASTSDAT